MPALGGVFLCISSQPLVPALPSMGLCRVPTLQVRLRSQPGSQTHWMWSKMLTRPVRTLSPCTVIGPHNSHLGQWEPYSWNVHCISFNLGSSFSWSFLGLKKKKKSFFFSILVIHREPLRPPPAQLVKCFISIYEILESGIPAPPLWGKDHRLFSD